MNRSFDVRDTVALVTGANRGIGKAIVDSLVRHGAAKIYAAARDPSTIEPLETGETTIVPVKLDLNDAATIAAASLTASDTQLVINNGGVYSKTSVLDEDCLTRLEAEMNTNVFGLVRMAHAFGPILKDNGGGAFVQINSVVALKPLADQATYGASKAASQSLTVSLGASFAEQGTSVLSVLPGPFATDMVKDSGYADMAEPASLCADEIMAALLRGQMHLFPGFLAGKIGEFHADFREQIIERDIAEVMGKIMANGS
jgi:NAD(P)-dependent dehydrogenase (short-subunit alcohol dehydrogenase family)